MWGMTPRREAMGRKTENGVNRQLSPGKNKDLEGLIKNMLACNRKEKRLLLYKLFCNLLGKYPKEEVGIYDPQGLIYGYFLPPGLREELHLLEDPPFTAELERRSRSARPTIPFVDIVKRLQS